MGQFTHIYVVISLVILLFLTFDVIFLLSWKKYIKENNWNLWLYKVPIIVSTIVLLFLSYYLFKHAATFKYTESDKVVSLIIIFWYVPKLIIVPVILLSKLISIIYKTIQNLIYNMKNKNSKVELIERKKPNAGRRKLIKTVGWGAASLPFISVVDGYARTTYNFRVYKSDVYMSKLPRQFDGLKIVQLSDIHSGSFYSTKPIEYAFSLIPDLKPDIILITGDYVNSSPQELKLTYKSLKALKADLGVYGSLGNHDHWMSEDNHRILVKALKDFGINMMINQNKVFEIDGAKLQLSGIDNIGSKQTFGNLDMALKGLHASSPIILMAHDPIIWDKLIRRKLKIDLQLSGHTHGGQIVLDILGEKITTTKLFYKEWEGLYNDNEQYLYVNRGFGTVGPPIRVGVDPEITLLTLKRGIKQA